MANSDPIKQQLANAGALETLLRAVRVYSADLVVQEQLLGLLVALVLRMADIAAAAAEAGAVEVLTEILATAPAMAAQAKAVAAAGNAKGGSSGNTAHASSVAAANEDSMQEGTASQVFGVGVTAKSSNTTGSAAAAAVQRQACMAVRNMVVRNPALRPGFLAANAEQLLRSVKGLFPASCKDVASAALRDLGLDNYNA
eukprot:GHRR01034045.1.p2 GENE.GHRR01034045.1~~GHRR01034045.1.p2  ORF type:complete len:199 (+),score=118.64 GHRR01034045.1:519-1115(+)